jgi:hypothetical protein
VLTVDPSKFRIGGETALGLALALGYFLARAVSWLHLWCVATVPIASVTGRPANLPPQLSMVDVTADWIGQLAAYVNAHYPSGLVSELRADSRREMYERWHQVTPDFARLVVHTGRVKKRIVGCCIIIPISLETFAAYRNSLGTPENWNGQARTASAECAVLFMPALHCRKQFLASAQSAVLAELFSSFAASHVRDIAKTVIVSPVMTAISRANMKALGFEMSRHSKAGFELWELDGRRLSELSEAARRTFTALRERRTSTAGQGTPVA